MKKTRIFSLIIATLGCTSAFAMDVTKPLSFHLINHTDHERAISCYIGAFKHPLFTNHKVAPKHEAHVKISHFIAGIANISCSFEPGTNGFYHNPITREFVFTAGKAWAPDAYILSTDRGELTLTLKYVRDKKEPHVSGILNSK